MQNRSQRAYFTPLLDHRQHLDWLRRKVSEVPLRIDQFYCKVGISPATLHPLEMNEMVMFIG